MAKQSDDSVIIPVEATTAMMDEADKLLSDPVIKKAFDKFIMLCELTKKQSK